MEMVQHGPAQLQDSKGVALIVGVILTALSLPTARPAATAEPQAPRASGWPQGGQPRGALANKSYLAVKDGSKRNCGRVTTNPTDHQKQQHWRADLKSIKSGSDYYDMKNVNSGKCLKLG
jgi:Ricin-type beta-trefoil lectin domain-like